MDVLKLLEGMMDKLPLSDGERAFIKEAGATERTTSVPAATAIYSTKHQRQMVDDLIRSQREMSEASDRYASRLAWFTAALVFVGLAQILFG